MKAISLYQPWASLVGRGKSIETRSWQTPYRGPIAIHAAKRWTNEERDIARQAPFALCLRAAGLCLPKELGLNYRLKPLPLGAIVAVATLVDCLPTSGTKAANGSGPQYADWVHQRAVKERAFGDYTPGRFGWLLEDIQILSDPIPFKGAQGLFEVPDDLLAGVTP